MRLLLKVLAVAVVLAAVFLAGFALWGGEFERLFDPGRLAEEFQAARSWAWAAAILLLAADLVLPIPATGVMAALGNVYGVWLGAAIGTVGATVSATLGYAIARFGGQALARRFAAPGELERFHAFFDRWGGLAIILSRAAPVLPEVVSLLAGLARMRFGRFLAAVLAGAAPTALLFAWLGWASREEPWYGMLAAVAIPVVLWPVLARLTAGRGK